MSEKKLNLWEKLLEIQKELDSMQKDASGFNYKYMSPQQVLDAFRPLIDKHKIILKPECLEQKIIEFTNDKGKHQFLTSAPYMFTFINVENPEERESAIWQSQGTDSVEKGIGSCHTYAERYFIIKFFHINEKTSNNLDPDYKNKENNNVNLVSDKQVKYIQTLLTKTNKDKVKYKEWLLKTYKVDSTKKLSAKDASALIKILNQQLEDIKQHG